MKQSVVSKVASPLQYVCELTKIAIFEAAAISGTHKPPQSRLYKNKAHSYISSIFRSEITITGNGRDELPSSLWSISVCSRWTISPLHLLRNFIVTEGEL